MSGSDKHRQKVLIVDDCEMNRNILSEMLGDEYNIIEAENGAEAIAVLQKESVNISLVLLDIVMPVMDGYEVLAVMNSKHWIEDVPVIMISSDNSVSSMRRAYELGITEFISRPFDALIVRHRVVNTIMLYAKQKRLVSMVSDQIYEREKDSSLMINILSHIVEFRNGESGMHVLNVQLITEILLRQLIQITDKYDLTEADISLICKASSLHDIGKISIPDDILNKPGRLSPEEFTIMKSHSMAGAKILEELTAYQDEPLVKLAYQICRWHHERYDGRGYPDGLKGDEIPLPAQIVALADVYDALTSERVYKKAFTHDKAMDMILNGECGCFNPFLLECFQKAAHLIARESKNHSLNSREKRVENISLDLMQYNELSASEETLRLLDYERMKNSFFASISNDILFEYTLSPSMVCLYPNGRYNLLKDDVMIVYPTDDARLAEIIDSEELKKIDLMLRNSLPESPVIEHSCTIRLNNEPRDVNIICRSVWNSKNEFSGAIGKVIDKDH